MWKEFSLYPSSEKERDQLLFTGERTIKIFRFTHHCYISFSVVKDPFCVLYALLYLKDAGKVVDINSDNALLKIPVHYAR